MGSSRAIATSFAILALLVCIFAQPRLARVVCTADPSFLMLALAGCRSVKLKWLHLHVVQLLHRRMKSRPTRHIRKKNMAVLTSPLAQATLEAISPQHTFCSGIHSAAAKQEESSSSQSGRKFGHQDRARLMELQA